MPTSGRLHSRNDSISLNYPLCFPVMGLAVLEAAEDQRGQVQGACELGVPWAGSGSGVGLPGTPAPPEAASPSERGCAGACSAGDRAWGRGLAEGHLLWDTGSRLRCKTSRR